ncbi:MAG: phosphomannomutase/phosphoglucomutase [Candidatus Shapirobacteria bacterium]|nr:phosphomannomutase/phosphoglucomutase [Candidatus Shapirobacteria bacterium]MDD4410619.1 phosphomannomutase/phosphoglucomutase [Candidatus Shapirobacteria bacterium]
MINLDTSIFKSYDIRAVYPTQANEELAEKIGRGFAKYLNFPKKVVIARDGRVSGESMKNALISGLTKVGVNVIDVDMASTDMFYYACQKYDLPGISVTASHNPKEYTGFKMVKKIPELLSGEAGIKEIKEYILADDLPADAAIQGTIETQNLRQEFVDYVLSLIDVANLKNFKIHADTANGMVGPFLKLIDDKLPTVELIPMFWEIDGNFPNHGGDPLLAENRVEIQQRVPAEGSDLGIMFDPDGDRFFVIDKKGRFVPGDFMTAILSEYFVKKYPGCSIVYDIRASKVVPETIAACGGKALANRVGHTHIKARMKAENAYFGGEVSGHYYFKEFFLCDTGLVTFAYLLDFLSKSDKALEVIVDEMLAKYHISGEVNSKVADVPSVLSKIEETYTAKAISPVERMDGMTFEMGDWRFNIRSSNTEPLLRLNLEANTEELMAQKRDEVLKIINS